MMALRDEFRTVIVRERSGRWWRRWRWAVEVRQVNAWSLKQDGYALTLPIALREAAVQAKPFAAKLARIEIETHAEHGPYGDKSPRPTPLPPQILDSPQPTDPEEPS